MYLLVSNIWPDVFLYIDINGSDWAAEFDVYTLYYVNLNSDILNFCSCIESVGLFIFC